MAIYYGNNVTTKYRGTNYTWKNLTEYTYTDNGNTFTVNIKVKFFLDASATSQLRFSKGNFYATLTINGTQEASFSNSPEYTIHGGLDNAWEVINFSKTYTKTASAQTFSVTTTAEAKSPSTWKGVSTVPVGTFTIDVPALSTMTVTATNGNATYNGSAHYAKIKVNVAGTTVEYGTSTSYGNSLTATNANTDYTLSSVSATNVADSKTVYYRVTKAGYVTVTGSTTITISKAANPMTYAAQSWAPTFSTGAQTKTLNAAASAQGTVTYSLQSQKQGSTTVNYFSFNTSTRVLTMAANTPVNTYSVVVRAAAAGNGNYNSKNVDSTITVTVGKAANPLAYTATQSYSKTFSTAAQTQATTAATGAQGTLSYAINSQKSGSTTVSYFSLSTTTLTVAANTPAGTYTVVIRATAAGNGNYNSATKDSTITFTINKANISPTITMANWAYGGTASNPSVSGNSGNGTVTYKYKLKSAADSAYTTTKPSDAGTYTIQASIAATTNYNAKTITKDFSITFTATPTAYSAQYNAAAHSASIKTSAPAVVVSYGTSTSYGYSVTCTSANTNYAMSSVTRTNTGTTTVYYSATKNGYTVTGSTTIVISDNTSMTLTATAYSAQYDGSAHSASIKSNLASTTINYGTSTSYGNSVTAGTSNVAMSAVTRTAVGTTTVYFQGTKTYYSSKTGSTTIKITPKFTAQSKSVTYNPSSDQNIAITAATGGTGYGYTKVSGSFSISGTNIVVPKDTAAGSYTIVVRATDTATSLYTDATYTITVNKATLTITPTAYNAIYNGAAHSASIKSNVASTTISYGTSTSYGNSVTAGTSNVAMSAVTRTNPGTTTVYYKATKTNYNDVTGSTTIKITGVPVHSNVSGTWKHGAVYLNINGTWKPATAGYIKVDGTWKSIDK